jgi:hypothetical protein
MATNTPVTELDFDALRSSLKQFLRSQTAFTDYDFDASNLSVLMDLLAYNTHYNAILANMVNNEMFLDTALKRSSVVSLAKHLNYIPRSQRSAEAKVNVTLQNVPGNPNFVTLNRYTLFNTTIGGDTYSFYNNESYIATPSNGSYSFNNVRLYQGRKLDYYYTVGSTPGPANKYVIPNQTVDTRTIQVAIQYGGSANFSETYTLNTNAVQLDGTSRVYFLEENTEGFYQIYFGDGVLGRLLTAGDIVKISYIVSDGEGANVSNNVPVTWTTSSIAGEIENDRSLVTISKPSGGTVRENIDSIRFNALNGYSANNRAVTNRDYAGIIQAQLPAARSVNVWGGEQNTPPNYGVVYISIAPKTGYYLTDDEKTRIVNDILTPRSMVTMRHEFIDPEYTYLNFRIAATFNTGATNRSSQQISALLYAQVQSYITSNLEIFNAIFYNSQLHKQLLAVDSSLLSVNIIQRLQKRIVPNISNTVFSGNIYFPAALHPAEITSTKFVYTAGTAIYTARIGDVPDQTPPNYAGTGTLKLYDISNGNVIIENLGSVNYGTGKLTINNLEISGYIGGIADVRITAAMQEKSNDIVPSYNEILELDDSVESVNNGLENGIIVTSAGVNA